MKRRTLLTMGGVAGLFAVTGIGLSLQSTKPYPHDDNNRLTFSARELAILAAVTETILPQNNDFPSGLTLKVAEGVDSLLSKAHPSVIAEIKQLLMLLENAAINALTQFHPIPFSQMLLEERTAIFDGWASSPLALQRKGFKALNGLCQSAYYAQSGVHSLVGYDGPPTGILAMVTAAARRDGEP
jgi:hypothetical protein